MVISNLDHADLISHFSHKHRTLGAPHVQNEPPMN